MKIKVLLIALLFVALIATGIAIPVAAQSSEPVVEQAAVFPPPEIATWASDLAVRGGWLLLAIALDLVLGVTTAVKEKKFEWQRIADILSTYGMKILGWLSVELLGLMPVSLQAVGGLMDGAGTMAYGILLLATVGSVLGHVSALGLLPVAVPGVKASPRG